MAGVQIAILAGCCFLVYAIFFGLSFTADSVYLRVRVFGWTVRKIALADIEYADREWVWWNEHYTNTLNFSRVVRIRRRSGWFKNFVITPKDPESFLHELRQRGVRVVS